MAHGNTLAHIAYKAEWVKRLKENERTESHRIASNTHTHTEKMLDFNWLQVFNRPESEKEESVGNKFATELQNEHELNTYLHNAALHRKGIQARCL